MKQSAYTNAFIFTGEKWVKNKTVLIKGGTIIDIVPSKNSNPGFETIDCQGKILAPAFIDLQIYGAGKQLFSAYPTTGALVLLVENNLKHGTATCLVTIATQTLPVIHASIDAIKEYWGKDGKGILGLHLEGPFINKIKRGAHVDSYIHVPTEAEIIDLLQYANGVIKMVTLAPETCGRNIIDLFLSAGVVVSAGHSNATFAEATKSFDEGVVTATHLFNAMSVLHHRDIGLPGAVLNHSIVMASIIPDGIHVSFETVKLAKKMMGERLFFITDAVTETTIGPYQHVFNKDHYDLPDATLSGSALTMLQGVQNAVKYCDIPLEEALRMASLYPARLMGLGDKLGKIKVGFAGDFVLMESF